MKIQATLALLCLSLAGCSGATRINLDTFEPEAPVTTGTGIVVLNPMTEIVPLKRNENGKIGMSSSDIEPERKAQYESDNDPVANLDETTAICLRSAGYTVLRATLNSVPNIIITPSIRMFLVTSFNYAPYATLAASLLTKTFTPAGGENPRVYLTVDVAFDIKNGPNADKNNMVQILADDYSIWHISRGQGAERAFRKAQKNYCEKLQQAVAEFKGHIQGEM